MRTFATAVLAGLASAEVLSQSSFDFIQYIAKHGKSYANVEEYNLRAQLFAKFDAEIKHHNQTERTSVHGHNYLSDWTAEEKTRLLGLKNMARPERVPETEVFNGNGVGIPTEVDWVTAGKVNAIQDQG